MESCECMKQVGMQDLAEDIPQILPSSYIGCSLFIHIIILGTVIHILWCMSGQNMHTRG